MSRTFTLSLAVTMMAVAAGAQAASTRAAQAGNPGGGGENTCRVQVDRNQNAGVFDLTRQVLDNGDCVCFVRTGPTGQGGSAEASLAELFRTRDCSDAPLANANEGTPGGGMGGAGLAIAGLAAAAAIGGLAAAGGSDDSPGG